MAGRAQRNQILNRICSAEFTFNDVVVVQEMSGAADGTVWLATSTAAPISQIDAMNDVGWRFRIPVSRQVFSEGKLRFWRLNILGFGALLRTACFALNSALCFFDWAVAVVVFVNYPNEGLRKIRIPT